MYYDRAIVSDGITGLDTLEEDIGLGRSRMAGGNGFGVIRNDSGGVLFQPIMNAHEECLAKVGELFDGCEKLLGNASEHLTATRDAYDRNEQANLDEVSQLWGALEMEEGLQPIGPAPDGSVQGDDNWWQASLHKPIDSDLDHWIWDVMSWSDWIPAAHVARPIIMKICQLIGAEDPFSKASKWLLGDWMALDECSQGWDLIGEFFAGLSDELDVRMQAMFTGWYDDPAATAAGEYFRTAAEAIASAKGPLSQLGEQYHEAAVAAFGFHNAIWSLIDAVVDAVTSMLLTGATFLEALAAPFTAGTTAASGVVTAIWAAINAIGAAWGAVMTFANLMLGVGGTIGAYRAEIDWVTLPEG
ncbi:hypothetical protein [uncultured Tessaracoccus sp.]|uniref:hypothetical protein n=1 Tax=uncultured Tessaracoccus sp. TaxID=905023 RepID=UPI0025DE719A|nr:hypothetical protein [uncultured Tessaracoccus sp.]